PAIDQVATGGLVEVFGGSYAGAVNVNKVLDHIRTSTNQEIPAQTLVTIGGAVTLNANTTFAMEADGFGNASANLTFGTTVTAATSQTLTINGGAATTGTLGGAVNVGALTTDAGGTTAINGGSVTTTGNQSYGDAVTLDAASNSTTLTGVDISFAATLRSTTNGQEALTVSGSGTTTFGGAVGDNSQRLASLTSNAGGTTAINGGAVTTTRNQTYNDSVTLDAAA